MHTVKFKISTNNNNWHVCESMLKPECQNVTTGPTLGIPEHTKWNDEKVLYQRSALIQNPNGKLTSQCLRTEMEVIMKGSLKNTGRLHSYLSPAARWWYVQPFSKAPQTTQDSAPKHKWKAEGAVLEAEIKTNLKFNTSWQQMNSSSLPQHE